MSRGEAAGKRRRKKAQKKVNLVFDETKRKDFLSGFQKRNLEKKKKAHEELIQKLKDEKRRIKQEAKESYKKLVVTRRPIPELEKLFSNEFETEEASVKIVELSTDADGDSSQWIGQNKPQQAVEDEPSEDEDSDPDEEEIPGMELKQRPKNDDLEISQEESYNGMSKKEINKLIKNEATKKIQKSKVFRTKNKVEQVKNKKKSMLLAKEKKKFNKKHVKTKKKLNRSKKSQGKRK
ncbi:uncharacterized protein LOC143914226 [Arctopsyche grandis]|uniref:uncharacterized protein LOC143914226 n=1 Tax=Arctopsyche grandis TaxID=121162 RepID=UPI00406D6AD3